ncbi:MAG: MBL fold metallo-hydrolase [Desulfarculus sp.]|nr:MAG: MBL fold metallo-hydrolase [Desulfarculus sp.]
MGDIIRRPGRLAEDFYMLGHQASPVFLLDGPRPVLLEAGFSCLTRLVLQDARARLGRRAPEMIFFTHSHFDHLGAGAWLLEAYPGLVTAAAPKTQAVLRRPGALRLIAELSDSAAEAIAQATGGLADRTPFKPFAIERVVDEGEEVELGPGLSLRVLATPGHTWDCLSFYIPQRRILIAGEAAGTGLPEGRIITEFLVDYQAYVDSIRRLAGLEVEVLCQGHHQVYVGPEVPRFLARSLAAAQEFRDWVLALLAQEGGRVERVMQLVKAGEYDTRTSHRQPLPAYLLNLRARVTHLAQAAGYLPARA